MRRVCLQLFESLTNMEVVTFVHDFLANPPNPTLRAAPDNVVCNGAPTSAYPRSSG